MFEAYPSLFCAAPAEYPPVESSLLLALFSLPRSWLAANSSLNPQNLAIAVVEQADLPILEIAGADSHVARMMAAAAAEAGVDLTVGGVKVVDE